jgi:hypothetical protein
MTWIVTYFENNYGVGQVFHFIGDLMMRRLYFDTCILNDFFVLMRYEYGKKVRSRDIKMPALKWTPEYAALYFILNLDDQWELEFGTSEITLQELRRLNPSDQLAQEKMIFLEEVYQKLSQNWPIDSEPVLHELIEVINGLLGPGNDAIHIGLAMQNKWDLFITTDFKTILNKHEAINKLEHIVLKEFGYQGRFLPNVTWEPIMESFGIKIRSPMQFLNEYFLPLPTLLKTLHGSWTDTDTFIKTFGLNLDQMRS